MSITKVGSWLSQIIVYFGVCQDLIHPNMWFLIPFNSAFKMLEIFLSCFRHNKPGKMKQENVILKTIIMAEFLVIISGCFG